MFILLKLFGLNLVRWSCYNGKVVILCWLCGFICEYVLVILVNMLFFVILGMIVLVGMWMLVMTLVILLSIYCSVRFFFIIRLCVFDFSFFGRLSCRCWMKFFYFCEIWGLLFGCVRISLFLMMLWVIWLWMCLMRLLI